MPVVGVNSVVGVEEEVISWLVVVVVEVVVISQLVGAFPTHKQAERILRGS